MDFNARKYLYKIADNRTFLEFREIIQKTVFPGRITALNMNLKLQLRYIHDYHTKNSEINKYKMDDNVAVSLVIWSALLQDKLKKGFCKFRLNVPVEANRPNCWSFGLITDFGIEILMHNMDTVFIDATHRVTQYGLTDSQNTYLSTIVVRESTSGKGVPVAFLISNRLTYEPLTYFILDIRSRYSDFCPRLVCVDCDLAELKALKLGFSKNLVVHDDSITLDMLPTSNIQLMPDIIWCSFHIKQALTRNMRNIPNSISTDPTQSDLNALRSRCIEDFIRLRYSNSVQAFNAGFHYYALTWFGASEATVRQTVNHEWRPWLEYLSTWLTNIENWVICHIPNWNNGVDTNNYSESINSVLRSIWIPKTKKIKRVDHLVYIIHEKIDVHYQSEFQLVSSHLVARVTSKAEHPAMSRASNIPLDQARRMVHLIHQNEFRVSSFSNNPITYDVSFDRNGIGFCSCPRSSQDQLYCKHIFLAKRVLLVLEREAASTISRDAGYRYHQGLFQNNLTLTLDTEHSFGSNSLPVYQVNPDIADPHSTRNVNVFHDTIPGVAAVHYNTNSLDLQPPPFGNNIYEREEQISHYRELYITNPDEHDIYGDSRRTVLGAPPIAIEQNNTGVGTAVPLQHELQHGRRIDARQQRENRLPGLFQLIYRRYGVADDEEQININETLTRTAYNE